MNIPPYRGILVDFDAISIFVQSVCACAYVYLREKEGESERERERERPDITRWGRKNAFIIYREKERHGVVLSWFSGPFFRAVFPDHRAPTFLPWPFDIKRRKPLSSYRVKRLFSNLLADIGFITFPRLSLSLCNLPIHAVPSGVFLAMFLALFTHLHCRRALIATEKPTTDPSVRPRNGVEMAQPLDCVFRQPLSILGHEIARI